MDEMARRKGPASPLEAMPEWMRGLKGFDELTFKRFEGGERTLGEALTAPGGGAARGDTWRIAIAMPRDIAAAAERTDPLLFLPGLATAIDELEARIAAIVQYCRSSGRSWSQIGEALSISKQAAWERFSGEE